MNDKRTALALCLGVLALGMTLCGVALFAIGRYDGFSPAAFAPRETSDTTALDAS